MTNEIKYLILGTSMGYTKRQSSVFVESGLQNIPNAQIVLFVDRLFSFGSDRVRLVTPRDSMVRSVVKWLPRGKRHLAQCFLGIGRALSVEGRHSAFLTGIFGVAVARYFWYLDFLENAESSQITHVLLSDTRDVLFQGDPFLGLRDGVLFTGDEPKTLAECPINSNWIKTACGESALREIGHLPILCSGVTGGPLQGMREYLRAFCREAVRVAMKIFTGNGFDQAIHNYLIYTNNLKDQFLVESGERLITMNYVADSYLHADPDGFLCNQAGEKVRIVHQYDRHPDLTKWIESKYGSVE